MQIILDAQMKKITDKLDAEKQIRVLVMDSARETLLKQSLANLTNGARGIGNIVESMLLNPLSRYLWQNHIYNSARVEIDAIDVQSAQIELSCRVDRDADKDVNRE